MIKTLLAAALAVACVGVVHAADIVPVNADPAGAGLNDLTPIAPAGGNPGTTVGEQRRIAYQFAADLWSAVLQSPAEIRVQASFQPLRCDSTGTVLGSAGTSPIYILSGGGLPPTLYHGALADALIGRDLQNGAGVDIVSRFNSSFGNTNPDGSACSPGSGWYYGLDGNTPAGLTNFLNTVMHEIAHGLGFSGFGSVTTGAPFAGYPDIYSSFVFDNVSQRGWYDPAMTNPGRRNAVIGGNLVFKGTHVTQQVPMVLSEKVVLRASGTLNAAYSFGTAVFGPEATAANFNGSVALVNDGSAAPTQGCSASPAGAYAGKVAIVDRGSCPFEIKAKNAENAGAVAVLIANNVAGTINLADDPTVVAGVPTLMVSMADGAAIKAAVPGVSVALGTVPGLLAGADSLGFASLYSPNPVQQGSSFSHYDTSATPNALMEPAITRSLAANYIIDLTPALFQDEGWTLNNGNAILGKDCDTGVSVVSPGGLIIGANVQAWDQMCYASSPTKSEYQDCMVQHRNEMRATGLITTTQSAKIASCAAKRFK
ncbi:MAG: serine protease [Pseudomonadota bacterium]|nr:serine protease [Pseudomonadota bacterium]MDQ3159830.1 serine protease [Pseudomonadota bacterium]